MISTLRSLATRDFRPLIGRAVFARLACVVRLCCCFHHLRPKETVLLKPSLQTVASNEIKETSHKNLNKNAAHITRFHWNICGKRQMGRVKNDCPVIARDKLD